MTQNDTQNKIYKGVITLSLPNTQFKVELDADSPDEMQSQEVLCTLSGKMRLHRIKVMPGDRVQVEITPYDSKRGRIIYREK